MQFDDINIGGQIKVGTGCVPSIGEGDKTVSYTHLTLPTICSV